jgi:elongation factor Ts
MEIKAADVMKLRKMTGAGMMDCKKALIEAEGDFARAQDIIREKGKLIVAKRADRTATEGVVVTKIVGQKAYILCLACETDFVAQNSEYSASAEAMLEVAVKNDAADRDALMAAKNAEGRTVEEMVTEKSGQTRRSSWLTTAASRLPTAPLTCTSTRSWVRSWALTRRFPPRSHTP